MKILNEIDQYRLIVSGCVFIALVFALVGLPGDSAAFLITALTFQIALYFVRNYDKTN